MRIAILAKPQSEPAARTAREARDWLTRRGHTVVMDEQTARVAGLQDGVPRDQLAKSADLAIVLGGDGTLLLGARTFSPAAVPIFGVNLGRLGFLTDTGPERMFDALDRVLSGDYVVEERLMLRMEIIRPDGRVIGPFDAFNDLVINKGALAQVIRLETRVDGFFVSNYLADGLIVATPTGSTAYGLAVGGPIVQPSTQVILVAPICPHMLTNRPLVLSSTSLVECTLVEARGDVYLTIDGQEGFPLFPGDRIRAGSSPHSARLVHCDSPDFFSILRTKMGWGGPQPA